MASRAELSQQTLVAVPVIKSVSMPRSRRRRSILRRTLDEGAVARLRHLRILRTNVVAVPIGVTVAVDVHRRIAPLAALRSVQKFVVVRPAFARIARAVADPHDKTAAAPHLGGEPVDVRHDLARQRNFALMARLAEIILHVDHDQSGFARIDLVERVQLCRFGPSCGRGRPGRSRSCAFVHPQLVVLRACSGPMWHKFGSGSSAERSTCRRVGNSGSIAAAPLPT